MTARGDRQEVIYDDDEDRRVYLATLRAVIERFRWICHTYCLMANHYHSVIETSEGNYPKGCANAMGFTPSFRTGAAGGRGVCFKGVTKQYWWIKTRIFLRYAATLCSSGASGDSERTGWVATEQLQRYDRSPKLSPWVKGGRAARAVWAGVGDSHTVLQEIRGGRDRAGEFMAGAKDISGRRTIHQTATEPIEE